MDPRSATLWCRWLCSLDVPSEHIAILLELEPAEVHSLLAAPRWAKTVSTLPRHSSVKGVLSQRPIRNDTANKIRKLTELGYPPERIAPILVLDYRRVVSFLKRATPASSRLGLVRPRTASEQRRVDATQRRRAKAAKARATKAIWAQRDARGDDAGQAPVASYETISPPAVNQAAELVPAPEAVPAPTPTRWDGSSNPRAVYGERNGHAKLAWPDVREIRRQHADGLSCYALARQYGRNAGTIRAIVRYETWRELDAPEASAPVPPPADKPTRKPLAKRRQGWRPAADEPKWGAHGSGALHDD
jgi:hypothetical protein